MHPKIVVICDHFFSTDCPRSTPHEGDPLVMARWLAVRQTEQVAPPNDVAERLYFSKRVLDSENPRSSANGSFHILGADLTSD